MPTRTRKERMAGGATGMTRPWRSNNNTQTHSLVATAEALGKARYLLGEDDWNWLLSVSDQKLSVSGDRRRHRLLMFLREQLATEHQ